MAFDLGTLLQDIKKRQQLRQLLDTLDELDSEAGGADGTGVKRKAGKAKRKPLSAAARKKIADAQRARWAKLKKGR